MSAFKFKVDVTEHERGWGSKSMGIEEFDTYEEAVQRIMEVNGRNTAPTAPDYYIQAEPYNFEIDPKIHVDPPKPKWQETIVYLHSNKEEMNQVGTELGLKGKALESFTYACYEIGIILWVELATGKYSIRGVKEGNN